MSIAGMGVNTATSGDPTEVGVQPQPEVGALFGMELRRHHVVAGDDRGEVYPVLGLADRDAWLAGVGVIAVHEVEVAAAWDAVEQRVIVFERDVIPANLRPFYPALGWQALNC